jgi:PKD repeat protein
VYVQVEPTGSTNQAPVASDDSAASPTGAQVYVYALVNDTDPDGDPISIAAVANVAHGSINYSVGNTGFYYTPAAGFTGVETITYTVRDSGGLTDTATVTVTVRGGTNRPPVAHARYLGADPGAEVPLTLTGTDPDGSPLTFALASSPTGGSLAGTLPAVTYTAPTAPGTYVFTFTVSDGDLTSGPAAVVVTVGANRNPLPTDDTLTVAEGASANVAVLANDTDLDNDLLVLDAVTVPAAHGTATCALNACSYQAGTDYIGLDSFTYRVHDGRGGSATAQVHVTITPVNDAPVAWPGTAPGENGTVTLIASDVDSAALTFAVGPPTLGTLGPVSAADCTNDPDTPGLTVCTATVDYDQGAGPVLFDTFTFTASDGDLTSDPATVSVGANSAPTASLSIPSATGSVPFTVSALAEGTDPDAADDLTFRIDWGDGSADSTGSLPAAAVGHTYGHAGTYLVALTVSDGTDSDTVVRSVTATLAETLQADAGDDRTVTVGSPVGFNGSNSRPTVGIEAYDWTFSDGPTAAGATTSRTFATAGTYTAELAVTAGGDTDTDTATITVVPVTPGVAVTVTNGGAPLTGADVLVITGAGARFSAVTGAGGLASIVGLPDGTYTVYAFAPGYQPGTGTVTVSEGSGAVTVTLVPGEIGSTVVETRELTYEEIVDLEIDPLDPANQHVFEFEIHLFFGPDPVVHTPVVNGVGDVLASPVTGGGSSSGGGGGGSSFTVGEVIVYPVAASSPVPGVAPMINYLVIPGKAKFLKEFFEVKLVVANLAAPEFTYTDGSATLELPAGLSLAPTADAQSLTRSVPNVGGGDSQEVTWIVRGDVEGDYLPAVSYSGLLEPLEVPVYLRAQVDPSAPLKVWAGSALEMIVDAEDQLTQYHPYRVRIGLHNVSDGPVYNPTIELLETGRVGYIYQPAETLERGVPVVAAGDTFWTEYVLMPWIPGGDLLLDQSFVLHTGGDVILPSTIIEHPPAAAASGATAVRSGDDVVVSFGDIPGAEGYDFYGTADVDTGTNGLQPDQAFGPYPVVSASGGDTSVTIPVDELAGYDWLGVSVYFPDGHREMFHNLVSLPETGTPEPVTIVPGGVAVLEGNTATTLAQVPVTLSAPSPVPVTATWTALSPGAGNPEWATADDFVPASGTVTFAPGETAQTVTVPVVGDTVVEDDEWVAVRFADPTNATIGGFWGLGLLLVRNDDQLEPVTIVPGGVTVVEGDSGTTLAEVPVTLSAPSPVAVTATWTAVSPGPGNPEWATADDFGPASGTVTFAPGETAKTVSVPVVGDTTVEADELVAVRFANPTNATLGGFWGLGLVLIQNDDVTP